MTRESSNLAGMNASVSIRALSLCAMLSAPAHSCLYSADAESHGRNYDESKVGSYTLPDPLVANEGSQVADAGAWRDKRRPEILQAFADLMYGHTPKLPLHMRAETITTRADALDGLATRTVVALRFFDDPDAPVIQLMLYVPNGLKKSAPVFLGLNYYGNASLEKDPAIPLSERWMRPSAEMGIVDNRATEATRGAHAARWAVEAAIKRGYAVATFYYGDVEPDHLEGWRDGIRGYALKLAGREKPAADAWGALGAWAWGLSRALDYLETHPGVDARRVAVLGHSRHGKAALWAGAQDERFALVISNNSGEGGASLARRNFGENIAYSIAHASWRYSERFRDFIDRANDLPFDQHMLIALMAPRPCYVASATDDGLADPTGEFLSAAHAESVYHLFGQRGLGTLEMPAPDHPIGDSVGYHLRTGGHDITGYDWAQYLDFADRHFKTHPASALKPHPDAVPNMHPPGEVDNPELVPFIIANPAALPGIVVDDTAATLVGKWQYSTHTPPYVGLGYLHDQKDGKGEKSATFTPNLPRSGFYEVRLAHCYNIRRATNTPVTIHHADGETVMRINQQDTPPHDRLFRTLGTFRFEADRAGWVRIFNEGTEGKNVIADAVQWLPVPPPKK